MRRTDKLYYSILLVAGPLFARTQSIGSIVSYKAIPGGISGKTAGAIFEVRAWEEGIVRVRVSKNKEWRDFSYALLSPLPATPPPVNIREQAGRFLLSTSLITVIIDKLPSFRITFSDRSGEVINEDMAGDGMGTTFIGDKVSVYKKLQVGERFVGLGEALGNLDRRGTGVTLSNTDNYKYGDPRLPMYSSIPFFIGIHHQPYLYSKFYETAQTGIPIARSLCIDDPFEPRVYRLPVFIKASAIVPMQSLVQSTKEKPADTLRVHIFYGRVKNKFIHYEDDGATFEYRQGHYSKRDIEFDPDHKRQ